MTQLLSTFLAENGPAANPFDWGLTPTTQIILFVLAAAVAVWALANQAEREDLHEAGDDHHDH